MLEKKGNRTPHKNEIEICLCNKCASTFYDMPDHGIERVNIFQKTKDICTICSHPEGFDFYVWTKHPSKTLNRTFEKNAKMTTINSKNTKPSSGVRKGDMKFE